MICEICHGSGRWFPSLADIQRGRRGAKSLSDFRPCEDCGGTGFSHCCDGLRASPEDEPQRGGDA